MANCTLCNKYFRRSQYNPTNQCEDCLDDEYDVQMDEEDALDIYSLTNPSGKTEAKYIE